MKHLFNGEGGFRSFFPTKLWTGKYDGDGDVIGTVLGEMVSK